jgi:hypothetical protein
MQITQIWMLSFLTGIEPASAQNGGSLRGHATAEVALRNRSPASPVLGCRLVAWQGRDPAVPAVLDPVRMQKSTGIQGQPSSPD